MSHSLMISRRLLIGSAVAGAATLPLASRGAEGTWPTRPVRLIVPSAPGQATDILGRLFADRFSKVFGQQFYVDNKAGAGATIGSGMAARAPADGYTLLISSSGPLVVTPAVRNDLPYDSVKDFTHITTIAETPQALVTSSASPFKSVRELVAAAKERPDQLNYGSGGVGTTAHLAMEAFCATAGIRLHHIPYNGNQQVFAGLISGDVAAAFDTVPGTLVMVKGGRIRALGVASAERSPFMPDVPTLPEVGYKTESVGWIGLSAPAGLPRAIVEKLNSAVQTALATPEFKETFQTLAFAPKVRSPASLTSFIGSERDRWRVVARAANVQVE